VAISKKKNVGEGMCPTYITDDPNHVDLSLGDPLERHGCEVYSWSYSSTNSCVGHGRGTLSQDSCFSLRRHGVISQTLF
jgi:hypothetical protein